MTRRKTFAFHWNKIGNSLAIWLVLVGAFSPVVCEAGFSSAVGRCGQILYHLFHKPEPVDHDGVRLEIGSDGFRVLANGVLVTGPDDYPTQIILRNLGLSETQLRSVSGSILSVGEGHSNLLPLLREWNLNARALDIWYHQNGYPWSYQGSQMKAFNDRYRDRLLRGSALNLPVEAGTFDLVLSHQLVNNLSQADALTTVSESLRVLRPGGEARHYGFSKERLDATRRWLEKNYGDDVEVSYQQLWSQWLHPYAGRTELRDWLLIVRRRASSTGF